MKMASHKFCMLSVAKKNDKLMKGIGAIKIRKVHRKTIKGT